MCDCTFVCLLPFVSLYVCVFASFCVSDFVWLLHFVSLYVCVVA